jgi:hypothetical protein
MSEGYWGEGCGDENCGASGSLNLAVLEKFCRAKKYLALSERAGVRSTSERKAKYFLALQNFSKTARFNDPTRELPELPRGMNVG